MMLMLELVKGGGLSREADFVATTKALFRASARQGQVILPDDPLHHCIYACCRHFGYWRSFRKSIPNTSSYAFGHQSLQSLVPDPRSNHLEVTGLQRSALLSSTHFEAAGFCRSTHFVFVKLQQIITNDKVNQSDQHSDLSQLRVPRTKNHKYLRYADCSRQCLGPTMEQSYDMQ